MQQPGEGSPEIADNQWHAAAARHQPQAKRGGGGGGGGVGGPGAAGGGGARRGQQKRVRDAKAIFEGQARMPRVEASP